MKRPELLTQFLILILIFAGLWMAYEMGQMAYQVSLLTRDGAGPVQPVQPQASPLASAAVQYHDGFWPTFVHLRDIAKSGELKKKQQAADYFAARRKPLGDAFNDTFDACCDPDGNIIEVRRAGLVAELDRVLAAQGAK